MPGSDSQSDPVDTGAPAARITDVVTLLEGSTFCVSAPTGDISPETTQGLFFSDTRIVSRWRLSIGGEPIAGLTVLPGEPFAATFITRVADDAQIDLLIERRRLVAAGMREDLTVRNLIDQPVATTLSLEVSADFADLFAVKEGKLPQRPSAAQVTDAHSVLFSFADETVSRGVRVSADNARATQSGLQFALELGPRAVWSASVLVSPHLGEREIPTAYPVDEPLNESVPVRRLRNWRGARPRIGSSNDALQQTLDSTMRDLGSLRIFDPQYPEDVAVAAGAPWFMALFGRDSLLTSYMALPLEPSLALGTLRALARAQGQRSNPATEEQPGRILHETRLGLNFPLIRGGGTVYYGTADATPLFVVLLGELARWGIAPTEVLALLPAADRALRWCEEYGDRDGDGFIEYERLSPSGLLNQGWKDSFDGITFADGHIPRTPIALCEVQGYLYAAYLARAELAKQTQDARTEQRFTDQAAKLRRAFNEQFWLSDRGWFAIGLDRDKRPIDSLASNMGHCLWTGIVDDDKASQVADMLMSKEMFTGWGIRTLASTMHAYNPLSYHNGSVWPHDNALTISGLMRYGFHDHGRRAALAILDAANAFGGRLPELFGGFDRNDYAAPIPYPTSCSPQAWASATPLQTVRALLGFEPDIPDRRIDLFAAWPATLGDLTIDELHLGDASATLQINATTPVLTGLPAGTEVRYSTS